MCARSQPRRQLIRRDLPPPPRSRLAGAAGTGADSDSDDDGAADIGGDGESAAARISFAQLRKLFHIPLKDAAKKLARPRMHSSHTAAGRLGDA